MRFSLIVFFLPIAFSYTSIAQSPQQTPRTRELARQIAITHVNVVDVRNSALRKDLTVLIANGEIVRVGLPTKVKVDKDATIIDGKGKYLIPGLWDMHVHLSYSGVGAFRMLIGSGVTSVRDMGGDLKQIEKWITQIDSGKTVGPTIYYAGPFIDGQKTMDAQRKSFTIVVETAEQGRAAVDTLKKWKVDFVKVHSRVSRAAFFAIAGEAKKQNIPLMVHAPKDVSVAEISDAGARSIEHLESLLGAAIYEKDLIARDKLTNEAFKKLETDSVFAKIKRNGSFYDPTLISLYQLKGTDYEKKLAPRLLPLITKLHKAHVPLLTGSDFAKSDAGIVPGKDLIGELELFVKAGLTPMEALQAATINAAKCMKVDQKVGAVETGMRADVVLLDANPLDDIKNTRKISKVILKGKVAMEKKEITNH